MDFPALITALSSLVGALTLAYVAVQSHRLSARSLRIEGKVTANTTLTESIHTEVASVNGLTGTELLERTEGRRIMEIPEKDRTPAEQGYVDRLIEGGRDL